MEKVLYGIISLLSGVALGGLYYGGLWWTVSKLHLSRHPALLSIGSFIVRTGIVTCGLIFISRGSLLFLALSLAGFFAARILATRRLGPGDGAAGQLKGDQ